MIKNVLKGMVIGIANIIPGVSGGTMMVAMGSFPAITVISIVTGVVALAIGFVIAMKLGE